MGKKAHLVQTKPVISPLFILYKTMKRCGATVCGPVSNAKLSYPTRCLASYLMVRYESVVLFTFKHLRVAIQKCFYSAYFSYLSVLNQAQRNILIIFNVTLLKSTSLTESLFYFCFHHFILHTGCCVFSVSHIIISITVAPHF